jgi:hypothetical protein
MITMPADINETDVCFCGSESLSRVQWLLLALLPHIEPSLQLLSSGCLGFLLQSWLQRRVRDPTGAFLAAEYGRRLAGG